MTTLRTRLSHLTDPDAEAAEQTRDALLSELDIPADWTVADTEVEIAQDGTRDWGLVAFDHRSDREKRAAVFLLTGSHALRVYVESMGQPVSTPAATTLSTRRTAKLMRRQLNPA